MELHAKNFSQEGITDEYTKDYKGKVKKLGFRNSNGEYFFINREENHGSNNDVFLGCYHEKNGLIKHFIDSIDELETKYNTLKKEFDKYAKKESFKQRFINMVKEWFPKLEKFI